MKLFFYALGLILITMTPTMAQTHKVEGAIVAFKKYPVNNVEITSKKGKTKVFSDSLGHFSILCNKKDVLVFDAGGFQDEKYKIKNDKDIFTNLIIIQNQQSYRDVVKGKHMSQEKLDYCLENLLEDNNNFEQLSTVFDVIQYVYPSAKVVDPSNDVGTNSTGVTGLQIVLNSRGVNSFEASPYALLLVDGIVNSDISGISPMQIKSVKVIQGVDAGQWGMQGANGVVQIVLKHK